MCTIIEKQEIVFFFFKLDFALIIELDLFWAHCSALVRMELYS